MRTTARPAAIFPILIFCLALFLSGCGSSKMQVCNVAPGCCGPAAACPAPPQHLFAAGLNGKITSFPVFGGTLGTPTSITGPQVSFGMAVMGNQFLYASNSVAQPAGSVDAWTINPDSGALTAVSGSPFSLGSFSLPGGLAANNNAQVLYVADVGGIDALHADPTGALTAISGSPFAATTGLYLAVDPGDKFLFASDSTPPGNVLAFTLDSSGALTAVPGSPFPIAGTTSTEPQQIVVDSSGKFVYVDLLTTNQIAGFSIDSSTGALTPVPGSPFAAGNGPLGLATANNLLYVSNTMDGTISGYTIDPTSGVLTPISGSPFAISAAALTANLSGNFLYTSGVKGLQAWAIDGATGALTQVGSPVSFAGATMLVFAM
ncbi:MAG TPA: beta-propeller fold lactonase family protein [Candidatus Sulfotelmatobacter sp.]|nr:beta-propeller fold lactonase family protein [Candidatus Sulfotelmatobacter sp.]